MKSYLILLGIGLLGLLGLLGLGLLVLLELGLALGLESTPDDDLGDVFRRISQGNAELPAWNREWVSEVKWSEVKWCHEVQDKKMEKKGGGGEGRQVADCKQQRNTQKNTFDGNIRHSDPCAVQVQRDKETEGEREREKEGEGRGGA